MFIMLDGIDGSGKSTIIKTWKDYLTAEGNAIFDLTDYWKTNGDYPAYAELKSYDFIFSSEPSYVGIGKIIREELINKNNNYPPRAIAESYSLDRLILYKKIIIPALQDKKCVVQDRGVSTSLCYQPTMEKSLTTTIVSNLVGNKLALQYRPDHLVLLAIDPEQALRRLTGRSNKQDNVIFERLTFQKKIARTFASSNYQRLFTRRGSVIHNLPAEENVGIMKKRATDLLRTLLIHHS